MVSTIQTNIAMVIDNSTLIKDSEDVVSTLNIQEMVVNLLAYQRIKLTVEPGTSVSIPFGEIAPSYVSASAKGELKMWLGWQDTYAIFSGLVTGLTTPVVITANNTGVAGNVTLTADSSHNINYLISTWNTANPTNQVTLTSGDEEQIPTANIVLAGGTTYTRNSSDAYFLDKMTSFTLEGAIGPITLQNNGGVEVDVDILLAQGQ